MIKSLAQLPKSFIEEINPPKVNNKKSKKAFKRREDIDEILSHIDPDCDYETWLGVGMALKAEGYTFDDWDEWSSDSLKYNATEKQQKEYCVINCRNGELWIDKNGKAELKPHKPTSYLNYVLNFDYEPSAQCPRFDEALLAVFQKSDDPDNMIRHMMEIIGYIIQPTRFITCWFMFHGFGENGKTKLVETIQKLLPDSFIYADRIHRLESERFAIGALANKLLLLDDDVDVHTKLPDGIIKKLSEQKLLTGDKKFKEKFEFVSNVAVLLLTNHFPSTNDTSHGMQRRPKIVPFKHKFTKKDRDDELYPYIWDNEMSGVLNRAIKGLQRLIIQWLIGANHWMFYHFANRNIYI